MDGIRVNKLKAVEIQGTPISNKMEELSGVMIIIIIGGGVLTFVMLFIFAKRQIMRFALRSRRGPHVPVGNDAKKVCTKLIMGKMGLISVLTFISGLAA